MDARLTADDHAGDPRPSPVAHVTRRLAALAVAAAAITAASYVLTVGTPTGQLMSELMLGGRQPALVDVASAEQMLRLLSQSTLLIGTLAAAGIAAVQRQPRLALFAGVIVVGANLTTQILKALLLDRGDLLDGLFYPLPNSFPSGHVTAAASIAVAFIVVLPPLLRSPVVLLSSVGVAIVAVSTLVAGWHRMADAIGGVFVATAWGAALSAWLAWRHGSVIAGRRTAALGRIASTIPLLVGTATAGLAIVVYLVALADPLDVLLLLAERGGSPALFIVGALLAFGMSLLALGGLGYALRDVRLDPPPATAARPAAAQPSGAGPVDRSRHGGADGVGETRR